VIRTEREYASEGSKKFLIWLWIPREKGVCKAVWPPWLTSPKERRSRRWESIMVEEISIRKRKTGGRARIPQGHQRNDLAHCGGMLCQFTAIEQRKGQNAQALQTHKKLSENEFSRSMDVSELPGRIQRIR
jgi:hypothetical protein